MFEKAILKLRARDSLSAEEEAVLREAVLREEEVPSDSVIVRPGEDRAN